MWQDWVFANGTIFLIISAMRVVQDDRAVVPRLSSGLMSLVLACFTVAYWTLGLNVAAVMTLFQTILWWWIFMARGPKPPPSSIRWLPASKRYENPRNRP